MVLAQLRAQAYGFWPLRKRKPSEPVNVYIGTECLCPPLPFRPECPVHGGWGVDDDVRRTPEVIPESEEEA